MYEWVWAIPAWDLGSRGGDGKGEGLSRNPTSECRVFNTAVLVLSVQPTWVGLRRLPLKVLQELLEHTSDVCASVGREVVWVS